MSENIKNIFGNAMMYCRVVKLLRNVVFVLLRLTLFNTEHQLDQMINFPFPFGNKVNNL